MVLSILLQNIKRYDFIEYLLTDTDIPITDI